MDLNINPELQKIKIGGVIYEYCQTLPVIIINQYNKEEYQNYFESINNIANMSGADLMLLFAEICTLVDGKINESIQEEFLNPIAIVAYAVKQSSDIISQLKENKDEWALDGQAYCFIIMFLSELFSYYSLFLNHLKMIKYTTSGMIVKSGSMDNDMPVSRIQSILAFILSQEFESLREKFKVIECYKSVYQCRTIH